MKNRSLKADITQSKMHEEYSRILTAAVVNNQFRSLLLANPGKAIDTGYAGETFYLAREEKRKVAAIRATSLADFATQLSQVLEYSSVAVSIGD